MIELVKRKTHLLRAKRGVSPVISTVILVAVAITVAVAVSYWMGGIAGQYTRFEKLEVVSAYAVKGSDSNYTITVTVKNTGSTDATIDGVYVNAIPVANYVPPINATEATDVTIVSGSSVTFSIYVDGDLFQAATTLEMKLHTAAGMDYPQMVTLP